jgi:single-strand DNA-binding protein
MVDMNKVIVAGNLTRDPEVRHIASGTAVADLGLAINRRYKDNSGRDKEEVVFVDVTVWDRQAENCAQYLTKGSPVLVEGRLKFDQWEKEGKKQSKLSVVAERVQFLSSKGGASGGAARTSSEFEDAAPSRPERATGPARDDRVPQEEILDDKEDVPF